MRLAAIGIAFWSAAAPIAVAAPEPLLVERLPDPDSNFVPPPPEPKLAASRADENPTLEGAMQDLGRVIGQATIIEQQQMKAKCSAGVPADATAEQRFAMEAACRYQRH